MNRRKFIAAIGAALTTVGLKAREPKAVVVYLVKAELKCTEDQARTVEDVLKGLGMSYKADPQDWQVSRRLYGAWEE